MALIVLFSHLFFQKHYGSLKLKVWCLQERVVYLFNPGAKKDDEAVFLTQDEDETVDHLIERIDAKWRRARRRYEVLLDREYDTDILDGISQSSSMAEKCQSYFEHMHTSNELWSNDYHNLPGIDNPLEFMKSAKLVTERLRIYERCFVHDYSINFSDFDVDARIFPFLEWDKVPLFLDATTGQNIELNHIPVMGDNIAFNFDYDRSSSWITNWKNLSAKSSGNRRGVVMTISDSQVEYALRLFRVIERQANPLPIQVIHKGDLSSKSIELLRTSRPVDVDLWIVDVSPVIHPEYLADFEGFLNKWLALIFNTFEEYVFIDADAVPLSPLDTFFDLPEYKNSGALFFKDRKYNQKREPFCTPILKNLDASSKEMNLFYSQPLISQLFSSKSSIKEPSIVAYLLEDKRHQMDSGLMLVDKRKHMMALMTGLFLNLLPAVSLCGHGDKEFIWLGFLLQGHNFDFHPIAASSIGNYADGNKELCSIQLAHTSEDGNLLWFNGGFKTCKFDHAADLDWNSYPGDSLKQEFGTVEAVRYYYSSAVTVNAAVVGVNDWRGGFGERCLGYTYCAKIENLDRNLVLFDENDVLKIKEIGAIWMG